MKKSIWIFLFAVLLPGFVLGWLALRSAEEQQIVFERRTAELYQKETEGLAASAREVVESERRAFGDTVHRLLARSDAEALARDFTNSLMDAWPRKAVGFVLGRDGEMLSPTTSMAAKNADLRDFLWNNGSFLCSTQPAVVYPVPIESNTKTASYGAVLKSRAGNLQDGKPALSVSNGPEPTILAQKGLAQQQALPSQYTKVPIQTEQRIAQSDVARSVQRQMNVLAEVQAPAEQVPTNDQVRNIPPVPRSAADSATRSQEPLKRMVAAPKASAPSGGTELAKAAAAAPTVAEPVAPDAPAPLPAPMPERTRSSPSSPLRSAPAPLAPAKDAVVAGTIPAPVLAPGAPAAPAAPAPAASAAPAMTANRGMVQEEPDDAAKGKSAKLALPLPVGGTAGRGRFGGDREGSAQVAGGQQAEEAQQAPGAKQQAFAGGASGALGGAQIAAEADSKRKEASKPTEDPATEMKSAQTMTDKLEAAKKDADAYAQATVAINAGKALDAPTLNDPVQARLRNVAPEMEALGDSKLAIANPDGAQQVQNAVASNSAAPQQALYGRYNQDALNRSVEPQQQLRSATSNWSAILPSTADFRALTAESDEGMLARFVQDKLDIVFWIRPPEAPEMVFGCLIDAIDLNQLWKDVFASRVIERPDERPPFVLALLNDKAKPVATFPAGDSNREWKHPFVANEIGEMLPHWEAALYLATPTAIADTARGLRRTISFTIAGAIALIAIGGWLVVHDVRRQLALAQQKTDFVSNVSHELKTPLTSIRMFAELMHDRPPPQEKQGQYLRIIQVEAERLTRLINNVLDFAKLERRQKRFDKKPLDLCGVITRVWEGQEMHLKDSGFSTRWQAAPGPYEVLGDEDALAQILVNLLSNAEKYSQEHKDIELVTWVEGGWINASVLDRGIGVPDGEERKIFEAFYRAHDSLSSGIQGSGLGLTLAQRLAREHHGEIVFERRQGGGSRFTFRMPLETEHVENRAGEEGITPA